jgi:hypothetical protein
MNLEQGTESPAVNLSDHLLSAESAQALFVCILGSLLIRVNAARSSLGTC